MDYAIVEVAGGQQRVSPGDTIRVNRLAPDLEPGAVVALDRVLMIKNGSALTVGSPVVAGAKVTATVLGEVKGKKVIIFKKKRRKQYRRTRGHRQQYTALRIDAIEAGR
ncbi:MAG TPA: 50S ribosomal protein L21 [Candidatus Polarisedimenticolia bacterium]|nr:50S ribosomal protein L21 [Candidatus Polarisedimenticolia bacterium]